MTLTFWTADNLFKLNNIVIIGWLALIFAPFNKLSKYSVLLSTLFLSIIYSIILFQTLAFRSPNSPSIDLFHLSGWIILLKNPFMMVTTINHFCIVDLLIGQWMVYDFYSGYTCAYSVIMSSNGTYELKKSWTFGRVLFGIILLITSLAAPVGFWIYQLLKLTFFKKSKLHHRIDFRNHQSFTSKLNINELQNEALDRRSVRFGDKLPESLRQVYHIIVGILGTIVLFTIALPSYIILRIYCRIVYRSPANLDRKLTPNKLIPEYVRNETASMKLTSLKTPYDKRNWIWYLKFLLLQLSTFIEYIPNAKSPIVLFSSLEDYFKRKYTTDYYVFGDGIAVNSYELVKRYLQDIDPHKGFESLGWKVSSSQATFCDFTTIFLSTDDPQTKLGRDIVFKWLHSFPYNLDDENSEARFYLSRLIPRKIDQKPDTDIIYQSIGEVMFFLATGGELRKNEIQAFLDCVKNPLIFFPNWFNFLLGGHYFERKGLNSYYTLLNAFSRYTDRQALKAAFEAAGNKKTQLEVLKLIAIVFSIAGSAAPAKLAVTVIDKLWSKDAKEKETNVRLFKKDPHNFIKECARLDKVVPMVNVLATKRIIDDVKNNFQNIDIPENTPIHCSLVNANRDANIFQNPDEFLPERPDLNKIIVWNGVEEDILNKDEKERPKRYCPGHDLSLNAIQFVAEQFLPFIPDQIDNHDTESLNTDKISPSPTKNNLTNDLKKSQEQNSLVKENNNIKYNGTEGKLTKMHSHLYGSYDIDRYCYSILDNYTKLVIKLMQKAVEDSNSKPSRGSDIIQPFNSPTKDLDIMRLDMAKFIPQWDEDEPNGSNLPRKLARWLVNQNIWDFHDCLVEFNTIDQAIHWRLKMFPALPVPNVIYDDMSSDQAMTQLAFAGCACHYTHRIDNKWHPGCGIPDEKFLINAVYVNDMTGLSSFRVRKPFERYGAAVYFDENFQILAIYWSHKSQLIKKGEEHWEHAKYVWRSSFFAYITICDHLIVTHMIECNAFVTASRKCLPIDHPLRIFIKPFTYHTVSVNYQAATSLVNERGLVHRIWAFDYDEFLKVCDYISMNYKFRILPDFISKSMYPKEDMKADEKFNALPKEEWDKVYPIYRDLNDFWRIIRHYVIKFFEINYHATVKNDNLPNDPAIKEFINEICKQLGIPGIISLSQFIDVLSQLIASSTGIHEHVGQISDYMIDPRFIGGKLQEGKEMQNIQTYTQILVLSVVTGLRMPGLLEDWSHLIEYGQYYSENLRNYRDFKNQLRQLSRDIDCRNKTRKYPFESFNPKYMECSTSV